MVEGVAERDGSDVGGGGGGGIARDGMMQANKDQTMLR